ncbi:MAG: LSU ribosomal protein L23p (L23Ae), partial [uncultured Quadrisphaera sp.]
DRRHEHRQGPPRRADRPRGVREELRPARPGRVHVPGRPAVEQDRDQGRRREGLRREGGLGQHPEPPGQAPSHPHGHRQAQGHQARRGHPARGHHRHLRGRGL